MQSLYDQYHSKENMKHMFDLINKLIYKNINKTLDSIEDYNEFVNNFNNIFESSEHNTIVDINRELLQSQLKYFFEKYNPEDVNNQTINESTNGSGTNESTNGSGINENGTNSDLSDTMIHYNEYITSRSNNDLVYEKSNDTQPTQGSKGVKKTIIISSSDRYDFKDSKFKYKVKNIQQLLKIIKLIIPIENSIHFTTPILKLKIKELNIDTQLYLSETYLLNNYRYGIYIPEIQDIYSNFFNCNFTNWRMW